MCQGDGAAIPWIWRRQSEWRGLGSRPRVDDRGGGTASAEIAESRPCWPALACQPWDSERDAEVDRALDDRVGAAGHAFLVGDHAAAAGLERDPLVGELAADVEVLGQRNDEAALEAEAARAVRAEPVG